MAFRTSWLVLRRFSLVVTWVLRAGTFLFRSNGIRGFSPAVQAILKGLKKHGMLVADNGLEWALSCSPDPRIAVLHEELRRVKGEAFEVVHAPR